MTAVDTFLEHYGVMGMRWGHRKQEPTTTPRSSQTDHSKRNKALAIAAITVIGAIGIGAAAYGLKTNKISIPKVNLGKQTLGKVLKKINKKPVRDIRNVVSRDSNTQKVAMATLKTIKPVAPKLQTIKPKAVVGAGFFDLPGGTPDLTPQQIRNIENAWDRWVK